MKKTVLLAALLCILMLPGCDGNPQAHSDDAEELIVVGFSQVGSESDWRVANTGSMKDSFSEANGYELIFDNARQKQENQIKAIRTFIQQNVDYIILAPVVETGWDTVLEETKAAGIPVIIVDRKVETADDSLYCSWVGSDFRREADMAMQWLEEETSDRDAQQTMEILHIQGNLGSTAQIQRSKGLEIAAKKHNNWVITAQLEGEFTQAKAYEVTAEYLKSNGTPDVVYCENDNMAYGVMEALDERGVQYGTGGQVIIISFDAARAAMELCRKGKINLCVECNPLHGPRVAQLIERLEAGETVPKENCVEEGLFRPDMVTQALIDSREY